MRTQLSRGIPPAKCRTSRERVTPARTAMLWTLASPTWAHSTGRRPGLRTSMPGTPRRTHPSFSHELPGLPLCRCRGGLCIGENGGFPCEGNEALKLQPWHPLRVKYEKYACGGTLRGGYECYDKCCEYQDAYCQTWARDDSSDEFKTKKCMWARGCDSRRSTKPWFPKRSQT